MELLEIGLVLKHRRDGASIPFVPLEDFGKVGIGLLAFFGEQRQRLFTEGGRLQIGQQDHQLPIHHVIAGRKKWLDRTEQGIAQGLIDLAESNQNQLHGTNEFEPLLERKS